MDEQTEESAESEIVTQLCVQGFIATRPTLTTEDGVPKFFARYGVERTRTGPDGREVRLEPRFHSIVAYREVARIAYAQFQKFDVFIAQGRVGTNQRTGKPQFEAEQIGHNTLRTRYEVDRTPRRPGPRTVRPQPGLEAEGTPRRAPEPHGLTR